MKTVELVEIVLPIKTAMPAWATMAKVQKHAVRNLSRKCRRIMKGCH